MRIRTNYRRREVFSVGIRSGWWDCIPSAFVQLNAGRHYVSIWFERKGAKRWTPKEIEGSESPTYAVQKVPQETAQITVESVASAFDIPVWVLELYQKELP